MPNGRGGQAPEAGACAYAVLLQVHCLLLVSWTCQVLMPACQAAASGAALPCFQAPCSATLWRVLCMHSGSAAPCCRSLLPAHRLTVLSDRVKHVVECVGDDPTQVGWVVLAFHGEGLACARLSVCKDGACRGQAHLNQPSKALLSAVCACTVYVRTTAAGGC